MDIEIRKLIPEQAEEYIRFFDATPHNKGRHYVKCYCVFWCGDDGAGKNFNTRAARREYAIQYVGNGSIQGYLAYADGQVVGWCNANTKADCMKSKGGKWLKRAVPMDESDPDIRIKSVFCFTIAPKMQRKGIATRLLERVCQDAARDGFDFVEAYPDKEVTAKSENFVGYADMYQKAGFTVYLETDKKLVMRKPLK